ncbi:MAG: hypothetical protein HYU99_01375 [Deltaproteobacteria bacterium]|nr:hypothetical protein [Deltaproteobacteria bacterium]
MAKYALIINGDTESRHLQNVERSLANKFEAEGYETYVASPEEIKAPHDHYVTPTLKNIQTLVAGLKAKIGVDDELVIYTTGHGDQEGEEARLCLQGGCDAQTITPLLDGIPYGQRTVVMDQNFSGKWNKVFMDDPKTLFIAAGSENEAVCCQEMAPKFWKKAATIPDGNDGNKDGWISWQERYAYAVVGVASSGPQFVPGTGYEELAGFEVPEPEKERLLGELERKMAGMMTENDRDRSYILCNIASQLVNAGLQEKAAPVFEKSIAAAEKIKDNKDRSKNFRFIASKLVDAGLQKKAAPVFEKSIAAAEKIEDNRYRSFAFQEIASALVEADLQEKAAAVFEKSIAAAEKINKYNKDHSETLCIIASKLVDAGLQEKAAAVFEKSIAAAEEIKSDDDRSGAFRFIASKLVGAGLQEKAAAVFEKSIAAAEEIESPLFRSYAYTRIASTLVKADLREKAVPVFEKSIAAAEKIENYGDRFRTLKDIAKRLEEAGLKDRVSLPRQ